MSWPRGEPDVQLSEAELAELEEPTERPCGCPLEYHLADCDGRRAPTKDDYLDMYSHLDVDDWPDSYD